MQNPYHNPPHIYLDGAVYFISARTVDKNNFFKSDIKKEILKDHLKEIINKLNLLIYAWVILDNHYHLLIKINKDWELSKFIKQLHGKSSFLINKADNKQGRQIWFNYWDHCIRNEADFKKHLDYIHYNPVKHGLTKKPENYKFSSYGDLLKKGKYELGWGYSEPQNIKHLNYDKDTN